MKQVFFSALMAGLTLSAALPLQAVQVAQNGTEAKTLVQDDGYIIFAYADGWDVYSRKRCEALMADKTIRRAAGEAVLMAYPIPEGADEAGRKQQEALRGELKIPGCRSYPALIFIDRNGWHYATLMGREVTRGSAKELAALITDRLKKGRERRRIEAEAFSSQDAPTCARLRFEAHHIDGLTGMDKFTRNDIRSGDPKDSTGVIRATDFNAHGFAGNIGRNGVDAGLAEVDRMLEDPAYMPRQKQQMCAAAIGMLRRNGGIEYADAMRRYAKLMQQLVPDSPEGRAAAYVLENWIPELRYDRGWNPGCIPEKTGTVELKGTLPIREAGRYTVRFRYTGGKMALVVEAVELYDGDRKIAEDRHRGVTGNEDWKNTYELTVPETVQEPRIFITFNTPSRDTYGKITIEKQ